MNSSFSSWRRVEETDSSSDNSDPEIEVKDDECDEENNTEDKGGIDGENLSEERQRELKNAKKYYEDQLSLEKAKLHSLEVSSSRVPMEKLPDKGHKLRTSIEKQLRKVKEINEQLSHLNNNILTPTIPPPPSLGGVRGTSASKAAGYEDMGAVALPIDLTKEDEPDLALLGKKALATHQKQTSLTSKTLENLHKFLEVSESLKTGGLEDFKEPKDLRVPLLPHQKEALIWLLKREAQRSPSGGILADDMGLGKTLTMIALLLKSEESKAKSDESSEGDEEELNDNRQNPITRGGTLVVAPSSVMGQWSSEVQSKVKPGRLSVVLHHGPKRETKPRRLANFNMVVTSYKIIQQENKEGSAAPLHNVYWDRIVLDEAHVIRNRKSATAQAVFLLRSRHRWVLTGTPVHNKNEDFFSLIKFLRCKPFDDISVWKRMVDNRGESGAQRLHLLTRSLLLRRTKAEIQKAGGLKDLQEKQVETVFVSLDEEEALVYERIAHLSSALLSQYIAQRAEKEQLTNTGVNLREKSAKNPFVNHPELGRLYNNMLHMRGEIRTHEILVLLLRLRQVCCHPSLVTQLIDQESMKMDGVEDEGGADLDLLDQMVNLSLVNQPTSASSDRASKVITSDDPIFKVDRCSSKMRAIIEHVSKVLKDGNDKVIIVSQWTSVLDILKGFLQKEGMRTVNLDGRVPVKDRPPLIEDFNRNPLGRKILLLSLNSGGTGLNLIGANHLLLIDIHWNPQLEAQASDRIYRVGQSKRVFIYKFLCKDTIEERILKLQEQKLALAHGILTGSSKLQVSKLTLHDLKLLFNVNA